MNPASVSGLTIAALIVMSLIVIILALTLIKVLKPNSIVGKDVSALEQRIEAVSDNVMADLRKAEPTVKAAVDKAELGVGNELLSLLGKVELRLTDTTGEDAAIGAAQDYLARVTAEVQASVTAANQQKQAKLAALQLHVATLTAANTPATGS